MLNLVLASIAVLAYSKRRDVEAGNRALQSLSTPPYRVSGPLVSVIIPTWNEADYLLSLITSLKNQTYQPIEIIVADWNSTDTTRQVAWANGAKVVDAPERGPGLARNAGAEAATGDLFLFTDADNIFEPTLVEQLVQPLAAGSAVLAHPGLAYYEEDGYYRATQWLANIVIPPNWTSRCIIITREAFNALGGYRNIWREDKDIGIRAARMFGSGSIAYIREAICATSTRRELATKAGRVKRIESPYFQAVRNGVYD